jgi:hypothetical protein
MPVPPPTIGKVRDVRGSMLVEPNDTHRLEGWGSSSRQVQETRWRQFYSYE